MASNETTFIEYVLSRVIETTVSSQLESFDRLNIKVNGQPSELLQGQAHSVTVEGDGLRVQKNLRVDSLVVQIKQLAIALLSSAMGSPELSQPASVSAQVVLTETDLNQLLNSDLLHDWLRTVDIPSTHKIMRLDVDQINCQLYSNNQIGVQLNTRLHQSDALPIEAIAVELMLRLHRDGTTFFLERGGFLDDTSLPLPDALAILEVLSEILHLRCFQFDDLSISIQHVDIHQKKLRIWLKADVWRIQSLIT
ncbi:MAG: LmeA family phospholipid-binding protein [Elainellaceae cyanobacterium]